MTEIKEIGGRPNAFIKRVTLAVYIDESLMEDLREVAGGVPLSTYVRKMIIDRITSERKREGKK